MSDKEQRFNVYGCLLDDHSPASEAYYVRASDFDRLRRELAEAQLAAASWKREAEINQEAADKSARYEAELAKARELLRHCRERIRSMSFENSEGERETYRILARIDAAMAEPKP